MVAYKVDVEKTPSGAVLFKVGFGDPAQNNEIVREAKSLVDAVVAEGAGGELALINGPASLPVAFVLCHGLAHLYSAIGVFDPKLAGYVVAVAHGEKYAVGDIIRT